MNIVVVFIVSLGAFLLLHLLAARMELRLKISSLDSLKMKGFFLVLCVLRNVCLLFLLSTTGVIIVLQCLFYLQGGTTATQVYNIILILQKTRDFLQVMATDWGYLLVFSLVIALCIYIYQMEHRVFKAKQREIEEMIQKEIQTIAEKLEREKLWKVEEFKEKIKSKIDQVKNIHLAIEQGKIEITSPSPNEAALLKEIYVRECLLQLCANEYPTKKQEIQEQIHFLCGLLALEICKKKNMDEEVSNLSQEDSILQEIALKKCELEDFNSQASLSLADQAKMRQLAEEIHNLYMKLATDAFQQKKDTLRFDDILNQEPVALPSTKWQKFQAFFLSRGLWNSLQGTGRLAHIAALFLLIPSFLSIYSPTIISEGIEKKIRTLSEVCIGKARAEAKERLSLAEKIAKESQTELDEETLTNDECEQLVQNISGYPYSANTLDNLQRQMEEKVVKAEKAFANTDFSLKEPDILQKPLEGTGKRNWQEDGKIQSLCIREKILQNTESFSKNGVKESSEEVSKDVERYGENADELNRKKQEANSAIEKEKQAFGEKFQSENKKIQEKKQGFQDTLKKSLQEIVEKSRNGNQEAMATSQKAIKQYLRGKKIVAKIREYLKNFKISVRRSELHVRLMGESICMVLGNIDNNLANLWQQTQNTKVQEFIANVLEGDEPQIASDKARQKNLERLFGIQEQDAQKVSKEVSNYYEKLAQEHFAECRKNVEQSSDRITTGMAEEVKSYQVSDRIQSDFKSRIEPKIAEVKELEKVQALLESKMEKAKTTIQEKPPTLYHPEELSSQKQQKIHSLIELLSKNDSTNQPAILGILKGYEDYFPGNLRTISSTEYHTLLSRDMQEERLKDTNFKMPRSFSQMDVHHRVGGVVIGRQPQKNSPPLNIRDIQWEPLGAEHIRFIITTSNGQKYTTQKHRKSIVFQALAYAADGRCVAATIIGASGIPDKKILLHPILLDTELGNQIIEIDHFVFGFIDRKEYYQDAHDTLYSLYDLYRYIWDKRIVLVLKDINNLPPWLDKIYKETKISLEKPETLSDAFKYKEKLANTPFHEQKNIYDPEIVQIIQNSNNLGNIDQQIQSSHKYQVSKLLKEALDGSEEEEKFEREAEQFKEEEEKFEREAKQFKNDIEAYKEKKDIEAYKEKVKLLREELLERERQNLAKERQNLAKKLQNLAKKEQNLKERSQILIYQKKTLNSKKEQNIKQANDKLQKILFCHQCQIFSGVRETEFNLSKAENFLWLENQKPEPILRFILTVPVDATDISEKNIKSWEFPLIATRIHEDVMNSLGENEKKILHDVSEFTILQRFFRAVLNQDFPDFPIEKLYELHKEVTSSVPQKIRTARWEPQNNFGLYFKILEINGVVERSKVLNKLKNEKDLKKLIQENHQDWHKQLSRNLELSFTQSQYKEGLEVIKSCLDLLGKSPHYVRGEKMDFQTQAQWRKDWDTWMKNTCSIRKSLIADRDDTENMKKFREILLLIEQFGTILQLRSEIGVWEDESASD